MRYPTSSQPATVPGVVVTKIWPERLNPYATSMGDPQAEELPSGARIPNAPVPTSQHGVPSQCSCTPQQLTPTVVGGPIGPTVPWQRVTTRWPLVGSTTWYSTAP